MVHVFPRRVWYVAIWYTGLNLVRHWYKWGGISAVRPGFFRVGVLHKWLKNKKNILILRRCGYPLPR